MRANHARLADAVLKQAKPTPGLPRGATASGLLWGVVVSIQAGPPASLTVTLAGSSTSVAGVRYLSSYAPVAGDTVLIAQAGADLVVIDRMATIAPGFSSAHALMAANNIIATATATIVPLDNKLNDPGGCFNTTTHQYKAPQPGKLAVAGRILMQNLGAGVSYNPLLLEAWKNGAAWRGGTEHTTPAAPASNAAAVFAVIPVATNDLIDIRVTQFSGGNANSFGSGSGTDPHTTSADFVFVGQG